MARKCPDCGHMNDNEMAFCAECGEPLDPQVRLIRDLENSQKAPSAADSRSRASREDDDDDDYIAPSYHEDEKKKSPLGWILLLAIAAAAVYFLFLRQ